MTTSYPKTRVEDVSEERFGVTVRDPYRWLEDASAPEVQAWMTAQDDHARRLLAELPGREALAARFRQLFYLDAISAPRHRGRRYFYARRHATREKAVYYFREGDGAEQVLLDPNTLSADGSTAVKALVPSWDGERVAYLLAANNGDEATLYVRDVARGDASGSGNRDRVSERDVIPGLLYNAPVWTPDSAGFYYVWYPRLGGAVTPDNRIGFAEVRFHRLGTDPAGDPTVHPATGDPEKFLDVSLSRDGRWLLVSIGRGSRNDVYYRDLQAPAEDAPWKTLVAGKDAAYGVTVWKDRFYIVTNEGAPRYRVMIADVGRLDRESWRELVPEAPDAVLAEAEVVGGLLCLTWLENATSQLELRTLEGKPVRPIALPGLGTAHLAGEPDEPTAYLTFTSYTQPQQIFELDLAAGTDRLWAETQVPVDPSGYTVEQVWYPSKDGTRVSMFLVHRKGLPRDGSTPFLLAGYGGFNISEQPMFQGSLYPWLEAGGGVALPNLRGGGEYGEDWHRAGMGVRKQNVFDDFIAAAEWLIANGYARAGRIAIRGGSNGGLLVGAAVTQRPELFGAVLCQVPLLDMVRFPRFGAGKLWVAEYGSPDKEDEFRALFAYSPYHRVKPGVAYPAFLMMSADSDDRVDPLHARKMTAALQAATSGEAPILLRIERHAGHGGADLLKQSVEQAADLYAFAMRALGMHPKTPLSK